ncbi:FecR domain-containing protein [Fusobacterium sp. PH5-44]|uniref:FecR domain-containing protein n=1 Tax=unclassified Fusobacterium TaxID=2648384 RepID=UPI003D1BED24
MKKTVVLLFFILIFNISSFSKEISKLNNIKLNEKLELKRIPIADALAVLSKEYNVDIIADDSSKDIVIEMYFSKGTTIKTIINSFTSIHNLKIKQYGSTILLTQKANVSNGEVTFAGKVTVGTYKNGIEGVKITVINGNVPTAQTSSGGNFVINDLDPGIYVIRFEKDGYITLGEIVNLDKTINNFIISLEKNHLTKITKTTTFDDIKGKSTVIDGEKFYTEKIRLLNIPAEEVKNILEYNFDEQLKITSLEKLNTIILFGKKEYIASAKNIIKEIDTNIKQVRVSSQILDVSDNLFEELGFDWVYSDNKQIEDSKGTNSSLLKSEFIDGIGSNFLSGIKLIRQFSGGKDILGVGINLLQSTQDLVISAIPSILISDGEEGEFKITEEVIVGEEKDENNETSKTVYSPLFREAGIILKVQPIIQDEDNILLKINIEVSNFKLKKSANGEESGTYNAEGGSKVGRSVATTIKMKNGETIFIGGLKRAILHNLDSKVPLLGDIPIIGKLFRKTSIKNEVTDIYIRLKVDLVENELDDFEKIEIHKNYEQIKNKRIYKKTS